MRALCTNPGNKVAKRTTVSGTKRNKTQDGVWHHFAFGGVGLLMAKWQENVMGYKISKGYNQLH
jgi:hypothetical protein